MPFKKPLHLKKKTCSLLFIATALSALSSSPTNPSHVALCKHNVHIDTPFAGEQADKGFVATHGVFSMKEIKRLDQVRS